MTTIEQYGFMAGYMHKEAALPDLPLVDKVDTNAANRKSIAQQRLLSDYLRVQTGGELPVGPVFSAEDGRPGYGRPIAYEYGGDILIAEPRHRSAGAYRPSTLADDAGRVNAATYKKYEQTLSLLEEAITTTDPAKKSTILKTLATNPKALSHLQELGYGTVVSDIVDMPARAETIGRERWPYSGTARTGKRHFINKTSPVATMEPFTDGGDSWLPSRVSPDKAWKGYARLSQLTGAEQLDAPQWYGRDPAVSKAYTSSNLKTGGIGIRSPLIEASDVALGLEAPLSGRGPRGEQILVEQTDPHLDSRNPLALKPGAGMREDTTPDKALTLLRDYERVYKPGLHAGDQKVVDMGGAEDGRLRYPQYKGRDMTYADIKSLSEARTQALLKAWASGKNPIPDTDRSRNVLRKAIYAKTPLPAPTTVPSSSLAQNLMRGANPLLNWGMFPQMGLSMAADSVEAKHVAGQEAAGKPVYVNEDNEREFTEDMVGRPGAPTQEAFTNFKREQSPREVSSKYESMPAELKDPSKPIDSKQLNQWMKAKSFSKGGLMPKTSSLAYHLRRHIQ